MWEKFSWHVFAPRIMSCTPSFNVSTVSRQSQLIFPFDRLTLNEWKNANYITNNISVEMKKIESNS